MPDQPTPQCAQSDAIMQQSPSHRRYSLSSYDDNLCLKPPLLLWLGILFLSRGVTFPLVVTLGQLGGGSSADTRALIHGLFGLGTLLPSSLAFLVLFALAMRAPTGVRPARWIWRRGRLLLATAAILDLALAVSGSSVRRGGVETIGEWQLVSATFDLYFLIYILTSRRVRDVFADFPEPAGSSPE
jgi:hypothetical protein